MNYRVTHSTAYDYSEPVTVSHHVARLEPRVTPTQRKIEFDLQVTPEPSVRTLHTDYFGNSACFFSIEQLHKQLEVTATSIVEVTAEPLQALDVSPAWETVAEMFRDPVSSVVAEAYQFVFDSPLLRANPALADYARESFTADTPLLVGVRDLTKRIHRDFKFDPTATTISTPLLEVFEKRHGVCQDFAHLAIACVRSVGLAAHYVSGYLLTEPPPGQPRLIGADYSHAWFSVFCPHLGFVDFDPTNDCLPAERHVTTAIGRDFSEVSPLAGVVIGGGHHTLEVAVSVEPID
ncbi:MAG: transglutaminase family protein [Verrucomicrobiota bacterium]